MPGAGPLDLFSPDNDPAVIEARKAVEEAQQGRFASAVRTQ